MLDNVFCAAIAKVVCILSLIQYEPCRSMYGGSKQDGGSQNGYTADSRQGGMQACKLIVACNKADLLPKQASLARIQVSCFTFMHKQVSAHEREV